MKKEIVSQSNSPKSAHRMLGVRRPMTTLVAVFALITCAASSALATQCEPVDFTDNGNYPNTVYVYATTATSGATIFATMGNYYIPADPTHNGGTPTGSTFICGGTFAVFPGDHKWFKAIAYKAGMTDSVLNIYEVDNSGN
jgi:hypothetical protein